MPPNPADRRVRPRTPLALLAGVVAVALLAWGLWPASAKQATPGLVDGIDRPNPFRTGHTLIIPHGGNDALYPEDTVYAYEHSIAAGGDVVDMDVQGTADGVMVAIHDSAVDRTTNGHGNVHDMTFAEIQKLDAGWSFKKGETYPFRGQGLRVPAVKDVMQQFPDKLVTLDLKDLRVEVVAPLCDMIHDLKRENTIYIGVDTAEQVMEFRRLCPEVRTSGTDDERAAGRAARDRGDLTYRSLQTVSQPSYLADDGTPRVTKESIEYAHARNVAVLTYVVDDPKVMQQLVNWGIDGIYTRQPDLLLQIVRAAS